MKTDYRDRAWMTLAIAVLVILSAAGVLAAEEATNERPAIAATDQCVACHYDEDYLPEGFSMTDIHLQTGLSCAGCHGGDAKATDPDMAMSPKAGFVGVPSKKDIPALCGHCHSDIDIMRQYQPRIATDQVAQYQTSVHGRKLRTGDQKVADCTNCHTAHAILPARDTRSSVHPLNVPGTCHVCHSNAEYMAEYGIPVDQYDKFVSSVHGKALLEAQDTGAPACNDCHGNHGAVPPGISSIRQVCGTCHVNNMQYFSASRMGQAFEAEELHGCEECHGNHSVSPTNDDMVGTGDKSVCVDCHSEGDKGYDAAKAIHVHLSELTEAYDAALAQQAEVRRIGMDDVEIDFLLQESHQNLIQSRTLVHTFSPEKVAEKTQPGVEKANEALQLAEDQIRDFHVRRRGFGMATLFITLLVVALFFKIRQVEAG